MNNGLQLGKR